MQTTGNEVKMKIKHTEKTKSWIFIFLLSLVLFSGSVFADGWDATKPSHGTLYSDTITSKTDASPVTISDTQGLSVNGDITTSGKIGLGTANPYSHLSLTSDSETGGISMFAAGYEPGRNWGTRIFKKDCYQGIGNPSACNGIPLAIESQYSSTWYTSALFGAGQDPNHPSLRTFGQTILASESGKVGIGTLSPQEGVHIFNPSGLLVEDSASSIRYCNRWGRWAKIGPKPDTTFTGCDSGNGAFGTYSGGWGTMLVSDSDFAFFGLKDEGSDRKDTVIEWGNNVDDNLRFLHAGTELMRMQPSGNVGIGTSNPGAKQTVLGGDIYVASSGSGIIIKDSANGNCYRLIVTNGALSLSGAIGCPSS